MSGRVRLVRTVMQAAALANVPKHIDHFSKFSPSPLSMKQFLDFGSTNACERTSFAFLRQELPVRLSNIMKEINLLPERLLTTPSVQLVHQWYDPNTTDNLHLHKLYLFYPQGKRFRRSSSQIKIFYNNKERKYKC
ncbi:hypothetical protein NL108_016376 [Boleophthalmus pectinirostris]|uniref:pyruvate dehydrogenase (acetyl-transferring) kinase isozyme 2, mitochondrial-like n=1 Tax=Boleophthalmus pectinirostris TaxID=150288 RepID=UPI002431D747|nr:pyruvate dehydrogenase (acetyl-transferring) kinase isozyme 2, mitochondrial-like [Boleophthalmus pectinirostris]KAJ0058516.1 hypothetical protein NL108_016376 [Boleophthalmus pectinirostris]